MKLLHWCTLSPQGPSSLAAVRFTAPIRVSLIRVFPTGAQPFSQCPDVVAQTEPESFFLDVFFNANPINPLDSKDKQRAPNALVPSTIAYAGGQADFTVDLGTEYATRLMIVKGQFDTISLAIYGELVSEMQPPPSAYTPKAIPSVEPHVLSEPIDLANASDPTLLARNLLALIDESVPLSLIVRLMFCLKPDNDDWDDNDFPYLYTDLDQLLSSEDFTLEKAVDSMSRPISDDVSEDTISRFAEAVAGAIGPKMNDQAFCFAKLLKISASQIPSLAITLCQQVDITLVFDESTLDEDTILHLLDATANADIARHFNCDSFLDTLRNVQEGLTQDKETKIAAQRLASRLRAWEVFEDALSNTHADFHEATAMVRDIGAEEQSIGIWLASMTMHDDIANKLAENPVLPNAQLFPQLFTRDPVAVSHDDFIMFVRASVGVMSVLAVWAWADSLGNDPCRERILAILRLWQGVDGYREIVNYLLLLRQLTRRLEWITSDNETPRRSGIFGEQIISELAKEPEAILRDDFVQTVLSLRQPLSFISESERLSMRKIALVVDDGLPAALDEIAYISDHPLSLRRLRTLRVSVAMVNRELTNDPEKGEWRILQTIWDDHSMALVPRLVEIFVGVARDLNEYFVITTYPPVSTKQDLVEQLFKLAEDLLRIISRLVDQFPLTGRSLRALVSSIADIFACTDTADSIYSQNSLACLSAQAARQTCLDFVRRFSGRGVFVEPGRLATEIILRTLLTHAVDSSSRDPVYHLIQTFALIDHVLPGSDCDDQEEISHWVLSVLPKVLTETEVFLQMLDVENKVHFLWRLVKLDSEGVVGLAEWLLIDELKQLYQDTTLLIDPALNEDAQLVMRHKVGLHLQFLAHVLKPTSALSAWCTNALSGIPEAGQNFAACFMGLLEARVKSPVLDEVALRLIAQCNDFPDELKFAVALASLKSLHENAGLESWSKIVDVLKGLPPSSIESSSLRLQIGQTLSVISQSDVSLSIETSTSIFSLFEWISSQADKELKILLGIRAEELSRVHEMLLASLPQPTSDRLKTLQAELSVDEDVTLTGPDTEIPDELVVSLLSLKDLLHPPTPMEAPSTPTRGNVPDVLGLLLSPPTALLRSPASTGLTKTYSNNDFRELRQAAAARQNTSRLPSMHVDVGINGQLT